MPDGKVYIGTTCRKLTDRWANGAGYSYNKEFYNAILLVGWDNIKHEILCENCTKEDAYKHERELIAYYKSNDSRYGYNHDTGGKGSHCGIIPSKESRDKRSEKMRGRFVGKFLEGKSPKAKEIWEYDLNGNFIKSWESTTAAAREYGFSYTSIVKCCTGKFTTANGKIWTYAGDIEKAKLDSIRYNTPKTLSDKQKKKISDSLKRHYSQFGGR